MALETKAVRSHEGKKVDQQGEGAYMPRFILNSQEYSGHHEVHDTSRHCESKTYPAPENQIDLGWHNTCSEAIATARVRYSQASIDGCAWCTDCHTK